MQKLTDEDQAALFSKEALQGHSRLVEQNLDMHISKQICLKLKGDLIITERDGNL
jgi:hypothetical protein